MGIPSLCVECLNTLLCVLCNEYLDFIVLTIMKCLIVWAHCARFIHLCCLFVFGGRWGIKYNHFSLWFYFPGTCIGTFCVDRSFTSDTSDGAALGIVTGLCLLWTCCTHSPRPFPSLVRENDDEVQVALYLHSFKGFFLTCLNF